MRSRTDTTERHTGRATRRRGSALVLVVGTLALIAVIAAFYVTLGQADTRVSRGVEQGAAVEDIERQFAEYLAGVVGRDRTATFVETITNNEQLVGDRVLVDGDPPINPSAVDRQRFIREATDYPYTDFTRMSIVDPLTVAPEVWIHYRNKPTAFVGRAEQAVDRFRFRPEGDESYMLDLNDTFDSGFSISGDSAIADRRAPSDPWLAASEPTFTGRLEFAQQFLGNHDNRNFSQQAATQFSSRPQSELFYLDNRDWAQISNPSPDGLSVNLWNLRNNFDAESGLGLDASQRPRMSENRTLLTVQQGSLLLRATDRLHIDPLGTEGTPSIVGVDPLNPNGDARTLAIKNTPAWWTMNQRFLYFPADPSFQILGRNVTPDGRPINNAFLTPQTPEHPDFPDHQYADADGDGMYDSRWYELTDSTLGPNGVQNLLANETGMRFFFAPRIIDLSGRVNVNTATDGLVPPTSDVPAGATPSEIDLRRLLTMEDVSEKYAPVFDNPNSPFGSVQRLSYSHIHRLPPNQTQADAVGIVSSDYERYTTAFDTGIPLPNGQFPLQGTGISSGRFAYDAIRRAIQGDEISLPTEVTNLRGQTPIDGNLPLFESTPFEYYLFDPEENPQTRNLRDGLLDPQAYTISVPLFIPADALPLLADMPRARRDYWHYVGGANIADPSDPPLTAFGIGANLFGLEDLSELLTFGGANDDRVLSRLERVTQGRFETTDTSPATGIQGRYGPLRANRPTTLERGRHDFFSNGNPTVPTSDNLIDHETMALLALNPRLRLTTLSGAAPIRPRVVEDLNRDGILSPAEKRLTSADARIDLTANPGPVALFNLYADALLPYSFVDATWDEDPDGSAGIVPAYSQYRTLSYGHRGSELALRISAHLAVNMRDMLDDNDIPSAYTVLAAPRPTSRPSLRADLDTPDLTEGENARYPHWGSNRRFDLGDDALAPDTLQLATSDPADISRQVYTVFGLEPQPFITEVSLVSVYSDVPRSLLQTPSVPGGYDQFDATDLAENEQVGLTGQEPGPGGTGNTNYEDPILAYPGPRPGCPPGTRGGDDGPLDDITIRVDSSPNNPDLMLQVLAVQLTNPFDVPINLSDGIPAFDNWGRPPGTNFDDNDGERLPGTPTQLDDLKYYIEYNGHFFALVDFIENPALAIGNPDAQPNQMHRVILEPGESRVFYFSAHPNLQDLSARWRQVNDAYGLEIGVFDSSAPGATAADPNPTNIADPNFVERFLQDQFAVRQTARDITPPFANANPLPNTDVVFPSRMVAFNPRTGQVLPAGTNAQNTLETPGTGFVDLTRTSIAFRNYGPNAVDYARLRQEVRLWRKVTADASGVEGSTYQTGTNPGPNWIGNDLLVDRMRDPVLDGANDQSTQAALDYGTMIPEVIQTRLQTDFYDPFNPINTLWDTAYSEISVPLTVSTDDTTRGWLLWGGTNQGATIVRWAGFRRPDHLEEPEGDGVLNQQDRTPRGLLPAWCLEGIDTNHNIATPTVEEEPDGIEGLARINRIVNPDETPLGVSPVMGEAFGFRGCHGPQPFDNDDTRGMFFMNFRRFMLEHAALRTNLDSEGTPILQNQGVGGVVKFDPMLVPTITRHPALKYRRVEMINEPYDLNQAGAPDEFADPLDHRAIFRGEITPAVNFEPTDKRTIARLGADPVAAPDDIIAEVPTLLTIGRDGLAADPDPRLDTVRLGDLVLPFGFGATFAPTDPTRFPANFQPRDWTTFAEAASAAMGYEPATFYTRDPGQPGWSLLSELIDAKGTRNAPLAADSIQDGTRNYERFYVLDNGRLDLHGFAPFVNQGNDPNSLSTAPQFNPTGDPLSGNLSLSDYRVGLSEPPAQRLLAIAQALSRGGNAVTTPLVGTVNINTASDAVLRTIPGFATPLQFSESGTQYDLNNPAGDPYIPPAGAPLMDWAPGRVAGKTEFRILEAMPNTNQPWEPPFGIGDPFGDYKDQGPFPGTFIEGWKNVADVPASLLAFRDRTRSVFRQASKFNPVFAPGQPALPPREPEQVFDFTPSQRLLNAGVINPPIWAPSILSLTVNNYASDFSRNAVSGQNASTEQPGMTGVGSLLGLTVTRFDPLASEPQNIANPRLQQPPFTTNWRTSLREVTAQGTVTRLANDAFAMAAIDQDLNGEADTDPLAPGDEVNLFINENPLAAEDNFSYTLGRAGFFNENPDLNDRRRTLEDEVVNDILEEVAVLNGAANTIDVRSDFYAAWFLVRGYREDDVQGLEPGEPMRPTYEKRFLMVLDRSNVTEAGQLPRVLFIREVPL